MFQLNNNYKMKNINRHKWNNLKSKLIELEMPSNT